jgi:RNA polymerase sigma-70 factor (ECF subfamily)
LNDSNTYQLLSGLKEGDTHCLEEVYRLHHPAIYLFACKIVRQETIAEEVTADVFITLWNKRGIIDPGKPIQALLYKIARDIAYNYLKKIANDQRLQQQFIESAQPDHNGSAADELFEPETLHAFHDIIDSLPTKRLQIFKLRYYDGMSQEKIAGNLGISIHTVKVHLAKARLYLKQRMAVWKDAQT